MRSPRPAVAHGRRRRARLALAAFIGGALAAPGAFTQQAPVLRHLGHVKRLPGRVVAEFRASEPETSLQMEGYRIEHVELPEARRVAIEGRSAEVAEGWRITVFFARPLTVRDQAFSLVIDGRWCGFLAEAADLKSADTVCFDGRLIREGAALGVTYRGVQIASGPDAEARLGPDAQLDDGDEPIHYSAARLPFVEPR